MVRCLEGIEVVFSQLLNGGFSCRLRDWDRCSHSGIVDEDVDISALFGNLVNCCLELGLRGYVAQNGMYISLDLRLGISKELPARQRKLTACFAICSIPSFSMSSI